MFTVLTVYIDSLYIVPVNSYLQSVVVILQNAHNRYIYKTHAQTYVGSKIVHM